MTVWGVHEPFEIVIKQRERKNAKKRKWNKKKKKKVKAKKIERKTHRSIAKLFVK